MINAKILDRIYRDRDYWKGYNVGSMASLTSIDKLLHEDGYSKEFIIGLMDAAQVLLAKIEEEKIKEIVEVKDDDRRTEDT